MNRSVLIIGNFLSAAGGSRGVCEELADRLPAQGWKVFTASNKRPKLLRLADMLLAAVKYRRHYAVAQVDVFSGPAFFWAEAVACILRRLDKPFVLSLHGGNLPAFAARWPGRIRRLLAGAQAVTAPSPYLQEKLAPYCPRIQIIRNPIDLARYPCRVRGPVRPKLVWVRAFHEIYNPVMAVKVAAMLAPDYPTLDLAMAGPDKGDGSFQRTRTEASAPGLAGRVRFLGQVAKREVPRILSEADIFLNTTQVDNTPVSVVEAMACGLCVVSTNVGGIPYLVRDMEEALLVPPGAVPDMARAVRHLLGSEADCRALSRKARQAASTFDTAAVIAAWNELFERLLIARCPLPG